MEKRAPANSAVIYSRYSSHNQTSASISAQLRECRAFANTKGLKIMDVYVDEAKTGTNGDRESFKRMIEDSAKRRFEWIIVHKLDRFSRNRYDAATTKRKLKVNGVRVLSVLENLDDSAESVVLESVLEGMAEYYSLNLAREVMKGMRESAYNCTHLGGMAPLGYDVDPSTRKYVINEGEAIIVRKIFEMYSEGFGYGQLLAYLNGMGYRTKLGRPFGRNSLYSILQNEKYVGKFVFNKKLEKDVAGKRNPQIKPEEEWIVVEGGLPAIIEEDVFNKVQIKMKRNKQNGGAFKAKEVYLLSGLVYCGECGSGMYGNTRPCGRNKTRYASYRCSDRQNHKGCRNKELRKEYLDNYVLDELYKCLFSDASINKLVGMLNDYSRRKAEASDSDLGLVRRELTKLNEKISKVVRLVSESEVSIDTVKEELKRLEELKQLAEGQLRELTLENESTVITEEKIRELVERSRDFVRTKNIPECRNFIESYVERVTVYHDRVEVQFKIHIPDDSRENLVPLKSEGQIKMIQADYRPTQSTGI